MSADDRRKFLANTAKLAVGALVAAPLAARATERA